LLLGVDALRDLSYAESDATPNPLAEDEPRRLVRHTVTENRRVERVVFLLEADEARAIGPLRTDGHASSRHDFRISCPELDLVVDTANANGALGARMAGGGSAIVLVDETDASIIAKVIEEAFAAAHFSAPRVFEAVVSAGARRYS
jgi:galactokinase